MKLYTTLFSLFLAMTCTSLVQAHAFLDHADPRVGSTVTGSPSSVKIWFTEELEGAFSKIEVFDSQGHEVDQKDSKVDHQEASLMTVSLTPLPAGTYKVVWHAVATDTHHTTGSFPFTVK